VDVPYVLIGVLFLLVNVLSSLTYTVIVLHHSYGYWLMLRGCVYTLCAHCVVACVIIEPVHRSQRQSPSWKGVRNSLKNLRAQVVATAPLVS
jgi:hypothetical protein